MVAYRMNSFTRIEQLIEILYSLHFIFKKRNAYYCYKIHLHILSTLVFSFVILIIRSSWCLRFEKKHIETIYFCYLFLSKKDCKKTQKTFFQISSIHNQCRSTFQIYFNNSDKHKMDTVNFVVAFILIPHSCFEV